MRPGSGGLDGAAHAAPPSPPPFPRVVAVPIAALPLSLRAVLGHARGAFLGPHHHLNHHHHHRDPHLRRRGDAPPLGGGGNSSGEELESQSRVRGVALRMAAEERRAWGVISADYSLPKSGQWGRPVRTSSGSDSSAGGEHGGGRWASDAGGFGATVPSPAEVDEDVAEVLRQLVDGGC